MCYLVVAQASYLSGMPSAISTVRLLRKGDQELSSTVAYRKRYTPAFNTNLVIYNGKCRVITSDFLSSLFINSQIYVTTNNKLFWKIFLYNHDCYLLSSLKKIPTERTFWLSVYFYKITTT